MQLLVASLSNPLLDKMVYAMAAPRDSDYNLIVSDHYLIFKWKPNDDYVCDD